MKKILLLISILLIFTYYFINIFRPITAVNEDLGRHLLLGKIIAQTATVPQTNLLSYSYPNNPFINSHWLSEVVFYYIHKAFGFDGLLLFSTVVMITSVLIIFFFLRKRYPMKDVLIPFYLFISMLLGRTDIRPEIFSALFLAIFITLLYQYKEKMTKWIYVLIPIELLWVNIHIYFFVGPLLIFFFLIDQLPKNHFRFSKAIKTLSITFLLTLLVTLINPNGITGALFPLTVQNTYGIPTLENQNVFSLFPTYNELPLTFLLITLVVLIASLFISHMSFPPFLSFRRRPESRKGSFSTKRMDPWFASRDDKLGLIDYLLIISFSFATIIVYRNVLLFAFATIIPLTIIFSYVIKRIDSWSASTPVKQAASFVRPRNDKYVYEHLLQNFCLLIFCLLLIGQIGKSMQQHSVGFGIEEQEKPAVDFFIKQNIQGPIFNTFDNGGYMAYRLYPQKVFIDNRPEAYPKDFAHQAYLAQYDPRIFVEFDQQYNFSAVILSKSGSTILIQSIKDNPLYEKIYEDRYTIVFKKRVLPILSGEGRGEVS